MKVDNETETLSRVLIRVAIKSNVEISAVSAGTKLPM